MASQNVKVMWTQKEALRYAPKCTIHSVHLQRYCEWLHDVFIFIRLIDILFCLSSVLSIRLYHFCYTDYTPAIWAIPLLYGLYLCYTGCTSTIRAISVILAITAIRAIRLLYGLYLCYTLYTSATLAVPLLYELYLCYTSYTSTIRAIPLLYLGEIITPTELILLSPRWTKEPASGRGIREED